jgi:transposase
MNKYTTKDFNNEFPTDEACLEWIKNHRYPQGIECPTCNKVTKHHRVAKRACYECDNCGHQIYPLVDTIFHKSSTPLKVWFQVIYRMSSTRCGISAKQIQRETGVTYKTAWRMFKQIRTLLGENYYHITDVELDETYVGGKAINMHASKRSKLTGRGTADKTPIFGIVDRGAGKVSAKVVTNTDQKTLIPEVEDRVMKTVNVYTDEMSSYEPLTEKGFNHQVINHSEKIYVKGFIHTNTIEGFWSLVKRGIDGVYHHVSPDYLQSYVNEYSFRYNHRDDETPMFQTFLKQV